MIQTALYISLAVSVTIITGLIIALVKICKTHNRMKDEYWETYSHWMTEKLRAEDFDSQLQDLTNALTKTHEENKLINQSLSEKTYAFNQCENSLRESHSIITRLMKDKNMNGIYLSKPYGESYEFAD